MHRLRYIKNLIPRSLRLATCLTFPYLLYHNSPIYCKSEVKQLSQQMFVQDILGNRKDYFFLVIYKEAVDGGYGEKEALEVAKKLQEIASKLSIDCHVYTISRPSLNSITKLIDRVKTIKIYEMEDAQKIEIYFKTPQQDDYVYFPFKKHSFYTENKLQKIYNQASRYTELYHKVSTKEELDALILENFYLLDSPLFLKSNTNDKTMKLFKRIGFQFLERKTVNLKSKFIIIDNKELSEKLKLKDDDILIMRNDILQKYENCKPNEFNFLIPQIINQEQFNNIQFESFNEWRAKQNLEHSSQKEQKQKYIHDFQLFILPRVSYLKNSKKPTVGTLVKRIQFHQNQTDKLVVSLQLDPQNQSRIDYHIRLQVFFKLYQKYKDRCLFVISATNQLEELLPHLNKFHSHFTLFNIFNSITYSKQLFPKTAKLYEKYFLQDQYFVERFESLDYKMNLLLQQPPEQRIENIDYISQDLDKISEINLDYFNYLQQSNNKCIVLYYQRDIMTDALLQVLKNIKTKYSIYTISMLNQIPQLQRDFNNQNVLIINGTAIGFPVLQDVNLNELKQQIENLIKQI